MSNINKAILKVAQANPEFAKLLQAELSKTAKSLRLPTKDGSKATFTLDKSPGVWAHVWFDKDVAQTDFGNRAPHSGEWQVILSTSEDPLNQRPRGRELGRKVFRYVEKKTEGQVYGAAKDFILRQLSQRRRLAETKTAGLKFEGTIVPKDKSRANIGITMIAPRAGEIALLAIPKYKRELDNKIEFLGRMLKNSQARMATNGNTVLVPGDPLRFKQTVVVSMNDTPSASAYHVLSVIEADMNAAHIKKV